MVLALVQDWASSAAVPLMGGPRVGATSNPRPGIRAEGAPDSSIRWAPAPILELITLRSNRRPPLFSWTAVRCAVALSCTLSCLVVVTHPVPPVCDQSVSTEGVSSAHARALVAPPSLCIFHTAFIRRPREISSNSGSISRILASARDKVFARLPWDPVLRDCLCAISGPGSCVYVK